MSFVEIKQPAGQLRRVDYMGGFVEIPAHHNWVAAQAGMGKTMLVSFRNQPRWNGGSWAASDEDFRLLSEIKHITVADCARTLRKVGDMGLEDCIVSNAEELAHKIAAIVTADNLTQEEKILSLFDSKSGLFAEFHAYQDGLLVDKVAKEKDLAEKRANANRLAKLEHDRKVAEAAYAAEFERQNPKPQEPTESEGCECGVVAGDPRPVEFKTEGKPRVRLIGVLGSPIGLF